jgi:Rho termination factor, N-terminal domain
MLLSRDNPGYLPLVRYFQFAEPFPAGVSIAFADSVLPDDEMANAAEMLREAEIEAVRTEDEPAAGIESPSDALRSMKLTVSDLESMSIDEVRTLANALGIPDRTTIVEKSELIEEILRRV